MTLVDDSLLDVILANPSILEDLDEGELDLLLHELGRQFESPLLPGRLPHQVPPPEPWFGW
ncbi:MAG: hypothetical protein HKN46_09395, partial [Acidimicrobiia bacterium]|nr:hypothetical protein [Acidimicrobiia bacterium]